MLLCLELVVRVFREYTIMSITIIAKSKSALQIQLRTIEAESEKESDEIMTLCPACKTFETVGSIKAN